MRDLIAGLLELARGDANLERRPVQLDEVVESGGRARTRALPEREWDGTLEPTRIEGCPSGSSARLEPARERRQVENGGIAVEVALHDGELPCATTGPGSRPRTATASSTASTAPTAARSLPGSGLGLAIVREVAEAHGGTVTAEDAPGGGALLRLRLRSLRARLMTGDRMVLRHLNTLPTCPAPRYRLPCDSRRRAAFPS